MACNAETRKLLDKFSSPEMLNALKKTMASNQKCANQNTLQEKKERNDAQTAHDFHPQSAALQLVASKLLTSRRVPAIGPHRPR